MQVPNINPDNGHVRFRGDLDDMGFGGKDNVIEYVIALKDAFDIIGRNTRICNLAIVWNAYDFEIGLRLWKSGGRNLFHISRERVLTYFSISCKSEFKEMLLVVMTIPLSSTRIKSTIVLELIPLRA